MFFKAGGPAQHFEAALLQFLGEHHPNDVLAPLAVDLAQGWMLLPDGGPTAREHLAAADIRAFWGPMLSQYARMQLRTAEQVDELLALRVPDRRLQYLAASYESLLREENLLMVGEPDGLTARQFERLQALVQDVQVMCAELADLDIPDTLQHGDLHDANVFAQPTGLLFFDWGDADVAHPFFSMLVARRAVSYALGSEEPGAEVDWMRDAYLTAFAGYASQEDLKSGFEVSQILAHINQALSWQPIIPTLPRGTGDDFRSRVAIWRQMFLDSLNGEAGVWR